MRPSRFLLLCLIGLTAFWDNQASAQMYKGVELVQADLVANTAAPAPGKPFTVGLRLKMAPHWHTYWEYSGDAGLPTKIAWTLPDGFKAGPIQWPVPDRIETAGDILNYGYSDEVVLLTEITPPAKLPGGPVTLKAKADWLVCADLCIPGTKALELTLGATPADPALIKKYQGRLPQPWSPQTGPRINGGPAFVNGAMVLSVQASGPAEGLDFFPLPAKGAELGHPKVTAQGASAYEISLPVESDPKGPVEFGGLLVTGAGDHRVGWKLSAELLQAGKPTAAVAAAPATRAAGGGFWHFLLFGFLGGLILNVMPCVLPVISLKIFSFIKQANDAPERIFKMGLAYSLGIFAWFLGFAALVVALKAGGREVGYAFHLQNPWFVVGLSAAVFVFSLNLLGVFEFILPGAAAGALTEASQRGEGYAGAFLQGVLATVLGSACTAPLFGAALGFAFAQSGPVIFAMFAAISLGMSLPFLLLTAFPAWLRFLPRPGAWMERVKQATGFFMLATLLWLLSVAGEARGAQAVIWTGVLLLALGAACWVQGSFNTLVASARTRGLSLGAIAVLVAAGLLVSLPRIAASHLPETGGIQPKDFPAALTAALGEPGRPVFVDFTAAWCINCKANERLVLDTASVQRALKEANANFLTADWTNGEAGITALLKQFGRAGVPLYVIYPADRTREPIILPEIITDQLVIDGLKSAAANRKLAAAH